MKNYLGVCEKDKLFADQIKSRYGDINMNNIYDVYDYAFTMFQLDGGTKKTDSVSGEAMLLAKQRQREERRDVYNRRLRAECSRT